MRSTYVYIYTTGRVRARAHGHSSARDDKLHYIRRTKRARGIGLAIGSELSRRSAIRDFHMRADSHKFRKRVDLSATSKSVRLSMRAERRTVSSRESRSRARITEYRLIPRAPRLFVLHLNRSAASHTSYAVTYREEEEKEEEEKNAN